jgi:hypothetical protein
LAEAGYRTINDLATETDIDRLALNTGLGIRKARQIRDGVKTFLESETQILTEIEEASRRAVELAAKQAEEAAAERAAAAEAAAEADDASTGEPADESDTGEPEESEPAADEEAVSAEDDPKQNQKVDLDNVDEDW